MTELLRLLAEFAQCLSPIRIVWQWQRANYYIGGRYQWTTGPGIKFIIPGLCDLKPLPIVPEIYTTPLQTITLRDNRVLAYSASITVIVTDAYGL